MPETRERRPWTLEHYSLFPDDGNRYEILAGQRFVTPSPSTRHQRLSGRVFNLLSGHVSQHQLGEVFHAPYDVVLSNTDVVQPDLLFVSRERAAKVTAENLQGAPDLVVEILSASTRKQDEILKRDQYEAFGVLEYWIVDPELETVKVYRARDGLFDEPETFNGDRRLDSEQIAGLRLELQGVFSR